MNDTDPEVTSRFHRLIMEKSPEERLIMGCSMFDTAKQITKSAIIEQYSRVSSKKMKEELFLRFYGTEFSKTAKKKISTALRKSIDNRKIRPSGTLIHHVLGTNSRAQIRRT